jgi:hypothetical protein
VRIPSIRDPNLFQRLVRKLMICEHGTSYQVVDDSGSDNGLDGFNRANGDLHAIYCPEKPSSARFRLKFQNDLEKAVLLRDAKQYPIRRFVFITPESLREPDQRQLRDLARDKGFEDGITIAGEHLEALLASHMHILCQFPEISYPQIEQRLDEVVNQLKQMKQSQAPALPADATETGSSKITGTAAQILILIVQAANRAIGKVPEADQVVKLLGINANEYREAVEELNALGLLDLDPSLNHPSGYVRARVRPGAFVQVASQVFPELDIRAELQKLLEAFDASPGESVLATEILQKSSVPLARAQMLIEFLEEQQLVETRMPGQPDALLFFYGRILPLGKRVLQGKDRLTM